MSDSIVFLIFVFLVFASLGLVLLWGFLMMVRNEITHEIRVSFLDDPKLYPGAFLALPSYEEMLYSPAHFRRWTKAQWVAWVEAQP